VLHVCGAGALGRIASELESLPEDLRALFQHAVGATAGWDHALYVWFMRWAFFVYYA
jgi:hypothetical protein